MSYSDTTIVISTASYRMDSIEGERHDDGHSIVVEARHNARAKCDWILAGESNCK